MEIDMAPTLYEMVVEAWGPKGYDLGRRELSKYHASTLFNWPQSSANWQYLYDAFATFVAEGIESHFRRRFGMEGVEEEEQPEWLHPDEMEGSFQKFTSTYQDDDKDVANSGGRENYLIGSRICYPSLGAANVKTACFPQRLIRNGRELQEWASLFLEKRRRDKQKRKL
jgi:hypothetical protein